MARQRGQDKQQAIVEAAVEVFAARGFWDTPTSLISKTAGVADGTLFNYFKTKNDLINAVYLELKRELADELLEGLSAYGPFVEKLRQVWNRYIDWGVLHPEKFQVLQQIGSSYELSDTVKAEGNEPFVDLQQMASRSIAAGEMRDYPVDYLSVVLDGLAITTIRFIAMDGATNEAKNREGKEIYKQIGFEILVSGIRR